MQEVIHIGIHTWDCRSDDYENTPEYVAIRNQRLHGNSANHLLLVDDKCLVQTIKRFGLGSSWLDRIFRTKEYDPTPLNWTFDTLSRHILSAFPAKEYRIWGAEVLVRDGQIVGGCVPYAYDNLRLPNKVIDLSACWAEDYDKRFSTGRPILVRK